MMTEQSEAKRGRRAASESRAAEIRARLMAWKQTPKQSRVSLRALAAEIGTSHQLLSFYLRQWNHWQTKEYRRTAREIRAHAEAESRPMTRWEEQRVEAYDRAAFHSMLDSVLCDALRQYKDEARRGELSGVHLRRLVNLFARKGYREEAQEILEAARKSTK